SRRWCALPRTPRTRSARLLTRVQAMDGRAYVPWFSVGETDEDAFDTLEGTWQTFVSVLRERAVTWLCDPEDTVVLRPEETGFAHLVALLYPAQPVFGAFFDGQGVFGTELHDQMYIPQVPSAVEILRAAG